MAALLAGCAATLSARAAKVAGADELPSRLRADAIHQRFVSFVTELQN